MKRALFITILIGVAIGALNSAHYYTTQQMAGIEMPFGLFPGGFPIAVYLGLTGMALSPALVAMLVLGFGIMSGSMLSAYLSGELVFTSFRKKKLSIVKAVRAGIGGTLMGIGTWMANGCLVKHTLSGMPGLMLSSFVTLVGIVAGIWISALIEEKRT